MRKHLRYADRAIKNAMAPNAGQLDYKVEGRPGLRLRVAASGLKTWTHLYRHDGKLRRGQIGTYPSKSLADADRLWSNARDALRSGVDPYPARAERKAEARRQQVEAARVEANTFRAAVDGYFEDRGRGGGGRPKSRKVIRRRIEIHAMPALGDLRLDRITRADVRSLTRGLVNAGQPGAALGVHAGLASFFRWAARNDLIVASPMADLEKPADVPSRDRVLTDGELAEIWCGCDVLSAAPAAFVRTLMLTGARRNEVGQMPRAEL